MGETDIDQDPDCSENLCFSAVDHEIEKILVHSSFIDTVGGFDIALLRLKTPVDISTRFVRPICLPINEAHRLQTSDMEVMGFGKTETNDFSTVLLSTELAFFQFDECFETYKKALSKRKAMIRKGQMCAGFSSNKTDIKADSCTRDSGGPLVAYSEHIRADRLFQYGIVSFGKKTCGRSPGVYTDVFEHMQWIADNVEI